ncbi:MAG TPA: AraC family transcriptional regulator, partial [Polyangiaceae bacterium]|nr:AraC family transcriptional regulator [Polyangiaceae bacterium]
PCVFVEFPGQEFHYGPWEGSTWEELYLIYESEHRRELERCGLFNAQKPIWYLGETRSVAELWRQLRELLTQSWTLSADRVDRLCEQLLVESLLCEGRSELRGPEAKVREIRHHIEQHYLEQHDFEQLSRKHGLSPTHFRRLWNTLVGVPPARYLSELRLRQACRMLVESRRSVATVADELGFIDPLYFSRKFRAFTGENPTSYRRRYGGREG